MPKPFLQSDKKCLSINSCKWHERFGGQVCFDGRYCGLRIKECPHPRKDQIDYQDETRCTRCGRKVG